MGKKDKKKKGAGAEKTNSKTERKLAAKQKKMIAKVGEADVAELVAKCEQQEARLKAVTETICPPPSPRSSFTLVTAPGNEELVLFGGEFYNGLRVRVYNDLFFYNIAKNQWKTVRAPAGPAARSGHQMVPLNTDGGQLWLFGGEHASPSQLQFYHFKDLWVMRLKTRTWEKINASNGPSPRSGHRMVASKKRLIVVGGFYDNNSTYRYYNDVHIFSLETYIWFNIKVTAGLMPAPRSGHCMAACVDGKILVWGGYSRTNVKKDVDRGVTHADMFALVADRSKPNEEFKWVSVKPGGIKPIPRSSVACCVAANGRAYCFGGVMDVDENEEDVRGQFGNELYSLELSTPHWRQLELQKKSKDSKSAAATAAADVDMEDAPRNTIPVPTPITSQDGVFTMTVATAAASTSTVAATAASVVKMPSLFAADANVSSRAGPTPRMNAGICVCKGHLYVFGGLMEIEKKQYTYNDFYALDITKLDEWRVIVQQPNPHEWVESESSGSDAGSDSDDVSDESSDDHDVDDSDMDVD